MPGANVAMRQLKQSSTMGTATPTAEAFGCHKPFYHNIEPCGIGWRLEIIAAFFCRFFVKIGPRLRYLYDVVEIFRRAGGDISTTSPRYLRHLTEISRPNDGNISAKTPKFFYFFAPIPPQKAIFSHQKSSKIPQKKSKNDSKTHKKYHFFSRKCSVFCSQNPIFLPKNHHI